MEETRLGTIRQGRDMSNIGIWFPKGSVDESREFDISAPFGMTELFCMVRKIRSVCRDTSAADPEFAGCKSGPRELTWSRIESALVLMKSYFKTPIAHRGQHNGTVSTENSRAVFLAAMTTGLRTRHVTAGTRFHGPTVVQDRGTRGSFHSRIGMQLPVSAVAFHSITSFMGV